MRPAGAGFEEVREHVLDFQLAYGACTHVQRDLALLLGLEGRVLRQDIADDLLQPKLAEVFAVCGEFTGFADDETGFGGGEIELAQGFHEGFGTSKVAEMRKEMVFKVVLAGTCSSILAPNEVLYEPMVVSHSGVTEHKVRACDDDANKLVVNEYHDL